MRRSSRAAVALTLSLLGGVAVAQTSIVGPVLLPTGGNANGFVEISWPAFQSGANYIGASKFTRTITAGVLQTTALYPTDTAVPSFSYTVRYTLGGVQSGPYSWAVPTSGSPVTIQSIQSAGPPVSPGVTFPYNSLTGAPWVTNATWKADVQASGSAGTVRIYDQTAVTGITRLDVRLGAGQSTNAPVRLLDNTNTLLATWAQDGSFSGVRSSTGNRTAILWGGDGTSAPVGSPTVGLVSDGLIRWCSTTTTWDSCTKDVGLARSASGIVEFNDGTLGGNGYGQAVSFILNPLAVSRPTCNSGNRGKLWQTYGGAGVTDTVAVCAKDSGDSYAWRTIF